jgi:Na+/H+-dicarboxylate symporter
MGIILPIYTIIDMIETAENVWSDSAVCAMTDHDLQGTLPATDLDTDTAV